MLGKSCASIPSLCMDVLSGLRNTVLKRILNVSWTQEVIKNAHYTIQQCKKLAGILLLVRAHIGCEDHLDDHLVVNTRSKRRKSGTSLQRNWMMLSRPLRKLNVLMALLTDTTRSYCLQTAPVNYFQKKLSNISSWCRRMYCNVWEIDWRMDQDFSTSPTLMTMLLLLFPLSKQMTHSVEA